MRPMALGLGYVDIYSSKGELLQRLEHGDWLNAPWGVALAPLDFGRFSHDLLIGQFAGASTSESSGFIAAYDLATGKFDGLLEDASGKPLSLMVSGQSPRGTPAEATTIPRRHLQRSCTSPRFTMAAASSAI